MHWQIVLRRLACAALIGLGPLAAAGPVAAAATESPLCVRAARTAAASILERWQALAEQGDADGLARLYAEDAVLSTGAGNDHRGPAAIAGHLGELLARHPMASVTEAMTATACDRASSTGQVLFRVTGRRKGTRMLLAGRFRIDLARVDDGWRIVRHELVLAPRDNRIETIAGQ